MRSLQASHVSQHCMSDEKAGKRAAQALNTCDCTYSLTSMLPRIHESVCAAFTPVAGVWVGLVDWYACRLVRSGKGMWICGRVGVRTALGCMSFDSTNDLSTYSFAANPCSFACDFGRQPQQRRYTQSMMVNNHFFLYCYAFPGAHGTFCWHP